MEHHCKTGLTFSGKGNPSYDIVSSNMVAVQNTDYTQMASSDTGTKSDTTNPEEKQLFRN
jgi:hypothetical protein